MTVDVNLHGPKRARARAFDSFDTVQVETWAGSSVTLFLPSGTAPAVADAINAAIGATAPVRAVEAAE